ncbi:unnamed protein product [Miscanthus lutarioriparius]|uniref:Uncharacterized protein n=1 Tax=Miscanthus lutarioriparius TaxID=422564 RepID=A0A811N6B3_9POAL|nr:unnamed protein product [Miscanthus lutarioriparius]
MGRDELLRRSLVALAAAVVLTGLATASLSKAAATYGFGILAIAGVLLPDWEFFDRDYSQWLTPMPASRRTAAAAAADREHDVWNWAVGVLSGGLGNGEKMWLQTSSEKRHQLVRTYYKKPPAHTLSFEMKGDCYFGAAD